MISPPLAPVLCDEMYGATSGKEDSEAEIENDNDSYNLASPISAIRHSDGFDEFESPDSIDLEDEHTSDRRNRHNHEVSSNMILCCMCSNHCAPGQSEGVEAIVRGGHASFHRQRRSKCS